MQTLSKLAITLFILSLPAAYFTATPAVLCLVFLLYQLAQEHGPATNQDQIIQLAELLDRTTIQVAELRTEMNAVSFALGIKRQGK